MKILPMILTLSAFMNLGCLDQVRKLTAGGFLGGNPLNSSESQNSLPSYEPGSVDLSLLQAQAEPIGTYADCSALEEHVESIMTKKAENDQARIAYQNVQRALEKLRPKASRTEQAMESTSDDNAGSATPQAAQNDTASKESFTNNQENGVDEADTVKIGQRLIFVANKKGIRVVDRETLKELGNITANFRAPSFYTQGDQLIVVDKSSCAAHQYYRGFQNYATNYRCPDKSSVHFYDFTNDVNPEAVASYKLSGSLLETRLAGGKLYVVMQDQLTVAARPQSNIEPDFYVPANTTIYQQPDTSTVNEPILKYADKKGDFDHVPCDKIAKLSSDDVDFRITKILTWDLKSPQEKPHVTGALGGGDNIYMTASSLYVTKYGRTWTPWVNPTEPISYQNKIYQQGVNHETLTITKFSLAAENGLPYASARGSVFGMIKDRYSLNEYAADSALAIVTTTNSLRISDAPKEKLGRNHLWVLHHADDKLELASSFHHFGKPREDVRSVRFLEDYAYVVTFKKTDPLFAFDMRTPLVPRLAGELEIPGFSMYLHPVSDTQLMGVGYDADDKESFAWYQGLQVSLFDTSDPSNMQRTANVVIGQRGSSSEVTHDPHAFFYDSADQLAALPVIELDGKNNSAGGRYANNLVFSGAIFYRVEGAELREAARISHQEWIPESCRSGLNQNVWWQNNNRTIDVSRIYRVGDRILTVSRYGIKAFATNDLETPTASVEFAKDSVKSCL